MRLLDMFMRLNRSGVDVLDVLRWTFGNSYFPESTALDLLFPRKQSPARSDSFWK